ncbi:anti-sigma factor [Paenibacillus jamilae]|uniref:zf-HC2 domain-containing protein n=1 Tax=Paenibacillus jamilae TaxID=114136 RepID=UPI0007ABA4DC|nr:zf-HC2 domain-containing protein [Paenibacillus jamilae]KZE72950.1 anti-sigma factor [Paenibacillus jamilae]
MKCGEEVMDWMQRYVDHELGEEETSQLMNHIATCPDCAEKFHILQTLSRELEELPAVSPAFSLVDSIMPQLDAIDRAREEQGSALQEMQPVAVDPALGTEPRQRTRPVPWWNRVGGRAAMGVAAAAVVLGIVVFNFEPKTVQDAEGILTSQSPEVTSQQNQTEIPGTTNGSGGPEAAIGSGSTNQPSEQGQGTEPSQTPADKEPDLDKQGADSVDENNSSKQDAGKSDDQQAGEEPSTKSAPARHSSRQDVKQGQPNADRQVTKEKSPVDAPKSDDQRLNQKESDQATIAPNEQLEPKMEKAPLAGTDTAQNDNSDNTSTNDASSSLSQELKVQSRIASNETSKDTTSKSATKDAGSSLGADSSNTASDDQQSSVSQDSVRREGFVSNSLVSPDSNNASSYGAQSTSTDQLNSPDGSYAVAIEGKKLKVYKLSDNGVDRTTLEVRTLKGAWVKGSWSDDSQTFMYETEQDGTASKYTYTVPRSTGK